MWGKPIHLRLDGELAKQMQDATKAEGTTLPHFIRSAIVKELKSPDFLPEIRELMRQQLNMYRGGHGEAGCNYLLA